MLLHLHLHLRSWIFYNTGKGGWPRFMSKLWCQPSSLQTSLGISHLCTGLGKEGISWEDAPCSNCSKVFSCVKATAPTTYFYTNGVSILTQWRIQTSPWKSSRSTLLYPMFSTHLKTLRIFRPVHGLVEAWIWPLLCPKILDRCATPPHFPSRFSYYFISFPTFGRVHASYRNRLLKRLKLLRGLSNRTTTHTSGNLTLVWCGRFPTMPMPLRMWGPGNVGCYDINPDHYLQSKLRIVLCF